MRTRLEFASIKPGDTLVADDGFTCIHPGKELKVLQDGNRLFVHCCGGDFDTIYDTNYHSIHFLDGQKDFDNPDLIVGFTRL